MKKSGVQRIYMLLILIIVLCIFELELMVNYPQQWIELIGVGCLIIFVACLIVANGNSIRKEYRKEQIEQERQRNEELQNVAKSEKANYLLIKKNFADLEDKFNRQEKANLVLSNAIEVSERKLQKYMAQMMEEEKKVARISVGRTKEYSESVLKSNEELKARLVSMESRLTDMAEEISSLRNNLNQSQSNSIEEEQYQKLLSTVSDSEERLKAHLNTSLHNVETQLQAAAQNFTSLSESTGNKVLDNSKTELESSETKMPEMAVSPELDLSESKESEMNISAEADMGTSELGISVDSASSLSEISETELSVDKGQNTTISSDSGAAGQNMEASPILEENKKEEPDFSDPNKVMDSDDINAILASIGNEVNTEAVSEFQAEQTVGGSENTDQITSVEQMKILESEVKAAPEPEVEVTPEPMMKAIPEPEVKAVSKPKVKAAPEPEVKTVSKPDFSDPNKMMGPDDIAALLAGMNGGEAESAKAKPAVPPKPAVAPKPLQPTDPNKVMSPDEIAALIAGL